MPPQDNNQLTPQQPAPQPIQTPAPTPPEPIPQQPVSPPVKNNPKKALLIIGAIVAAIILLLVVAALIVTPGMRDAANRQAVGTQHNVSSDSELGKGIAELDKSQATAQAQANARQLSSLAATYKSKAGSYPPAIDDFQKYRESAVPSAANKYISKTKPTSGDTIYYQRCTATSAQITYFDSVQNKQVIYDVTTNKTTTSSCS
jgi:hypothetical protein